MGITNLNLSAVLSELGDHKQSLKCALEAA